MQVRAAEAELRHKLFPPNAWMKVLHFNVLTSCPKDELHQWFIGLYGEPLHTMDHAGAAMFMRSKPGCGTLAGPSLEWVAFWSPRPKRIRRKSRSEAARRAWKTKMPGSGQLKRKSRAEDIWHAYTCHIPVIYDCSVKHALQGIVWYPSPRNAYLHIGSD